MKRTLIICVILFLLLGVSFFSYNLISNLKNEVERVPFAESKLAQDLVINGRAVIIIHPITKDKLVRFIE